MGIIKNLPEGDLVILSTAIYHRMEVFVTGNTKDLGYLLGDRNRKNADCDTRRFLREEVETGKRELKW